MRHDAFKRAIVCPATDERVCPSACLSCGRRRLQNVLQSGVIISFHDNGFDYPPPDGLTEACIDPSRNFHCVGIPPHSCSAFGAATTDYYGLSSELANRYFGGDAERYLVRTDKAAKKLADGRNERISASMIFGGLHRTGWLLD